MGILTRFKDIMESNINALLDKAEDPEKMVDQYLRELEEDLAKVKAETASVMADEKSAKRKLDDCKADVDKMASYAMKAVEAGNDEDARKFLEKKATLSEQMASLQKNYDMCVANSEKMKGMHKKLEEDIEVMRSKRDMLKAQAKVAETQKKINNLGASADKAGSTMAAFNRMEERINKMTDEAEAMNALNADAVDDVSALASKYDSNETNSSVDDELAALKAQLGK